MSNAIFQFWAGNMPEYAKVSKRYFERYAEAVGADYLFTQPEPSAKAGYNYASHLYENLDFDTYDKILFVDMDIIPTCNKNIFDFEVKEVLGVPESRWPGMVEGYNPTTLDVNCHYYKGLTKRYSEYGVEKPPVSSLHPQYRREINTGVMVWTKEARLKARSCFDDIVSWERNGSGSLAYDQPFFNVQFAKHNFKVAEIGHEWNSNPVRAEESLKTNFIFEHYHGIKPKEIMLEKYS